MDALPTNRTTFISFLSCSLFISLFFHFPHFFYFMLIYFISLYFIYFFLFPLPSFHRLLFPFNLSSSLVIFSFIVFCFYSVLSLLLPSRHSSSVAVVLLASFLHLALRLRSDLPSNYSSLVLLHPSCLIQELRHTSNIYVRVNSNSVTFEKYGLLGEVFYECL